MILYLIRHGRSIANRRGLVTGTPDDRLDEVGRDQAAALGQWVAGLGVTPQRFVMSQWQRAQETAAALFPQATWEVDRRLGETDAGEVANLPLAAFLESHAAFYRDPANAYPGGESHLDLNRRVLQWLDELLRDPCRSLAVATHSGPIACLLQHIHGLDMRRFPAFLPAHATVTVVRFARRDGAWCGVLAGFALGPPENLRGIVHDEA